MAKEKEGEKKQKITHDLRNNGTESIIEENDDKDDSIIALRNEIQSLKKKIADKRKPSMILSKNGMKCATHGISNETRIRTRLGKFCDE